MKVIHDTILRPEDIADIRFLVRTYYPPQDNGSRFDFEYVDNLHWYMTKLFELALEKQIIESQASVH